VIGHCTRKALAVASLPFVWRWFEIQHLSQTAFTSYLVMMVPTAVVQNHRYQTVYERMAHRTLGCLLGSTAVTGSAVPCLLMLLWLVPEDNLVSNRKLA